MTRTELVAALQAALAAASAVTTAAAAGEYTTIATGEAAINAVRASIASLLPQIDATWGVDGTPARAAMVTVAARLLDLRSMLSDTTATVSEEIVVETSAAECAVRWWGDLDRWTEVAAMNPDVPNPARILPGTTLVHRVQ